MRPGASPLLVDGGASAGTHLFVRRRDKLVPPAWPALVALASVVLLSSGLMVYDIVGDVETEVRTTDLVDDALRSVALADDLRRQVHTLTAGSEDHQVVATALGRIGADMAMYAPLARYPGERDEWTRLERLVERLQQLAPATLAVDTKLLGEIEGSLDRVVEINERQAKSNVGAIRSSFHQDYGLDAVGLTITIVLAFAVAAVLSRSIRRQRALLAAHLRAQDERARELEAFAGRVAHDLRGPLAPLRGCADLLLLGKGPPPQELGKRIANAIERMTAIIDELLALSLSGRPDVGETEVAPVVAQVLEDVGPLPSDSKVELAIPEGRVRCSRSALGRIMQNLVSNAIKYRAPERPLDLHITASHVDHAIELVVADNGIGMDEATAAHAFDPLFRGDGTHKIAGHGLGLAIVKRTVDAFGGSCSIASKPSVGTRIVVRLPAQ